MTGTRDWGKAGLMPTIETLVSRDCSPQQQTQTETKGDVSTLLKGQITWNHSPSNETRSVATDSILTEADRPCTSAEKRVLLLRFQTTLGKQNKILGIRCEFPVVLTSDCPTETRGGPDQGVTEVRGRCKREDSPMRRTLGPTVSGWLLDVHTHTHTHTPPTPHHSQSATQQLRGGGEELRRRRRRPVNNGAKLLLKRFQSSFRQCCSPSTDCFAIFCSVNLLSVCPCLVFDIRAGFGFGHALADSCLSIIN